MADNAGPLPAGRFFAIAVAALLTGFAGVASAATGGAATPGGTPTARPSPAGAPAAGVPSAGALSLVSAQTSPRKSFYYGFRYPRLRFEIGSTQPQNDLRIDVVDAKGEIVKSFYRNDVAPNTANSVRWDGTTAAARPARNGRYRFRVLPQRAGAEARRAMARSIRRAKRRAASSSRAFSLGFALYGFAFPVLGAHDFGGAGARFGTGRAGHSHQGQDVMAGCGQPLVAARGGRVQLSDHHGSAGHYVVIDGRASPWDFMYAHLAKPSPLRKGDIVRTGQPVGAVGRSGNASACHLHFEIWRAPGWYEGGSPLDPFALLKRWDRYS